MKTLFPNDPPGHFSPSDPHADPNDLWDAVKEKLKVIVDQETFEKWIEPLTATIEGPNECVVTLPNLVFYQGIQTEYLDKIEQFKAELGFDHFIIRFHVQGSDPTAELDLFSSPFGASEVSETADPRTWESEATAVSARSDSQSGAFSRSLSTEGHLNRNYSFSNFIKGDSNQFAAATCLSAAQNPGQAYNPLFIYGSTGLGKTHLLHAVGNLVLKQNPNAVVTYIPSERFMNELVYCLRFAKMVEFRQKYRNCDVLLVDDVQFISGKKTTQQEFFHTFNTLYAAKKQIVITSDLFPKDIPDIEERLRNRFQWGLIADIQPPSIEHRIEILYSKADELKVDLKRDVAEYIAKHAKRNVRELEGALHRLNAYSQFQGVDISVSLASTIFKDVVPETVRNLTIEMVQKLVADHYKIKVADLKSKKRQRAFSHPRQVAMYMARKMLGASFPEIGEKFGGKDHTTVLHNVRKIEEALDRDLDLKADLEALERQFERLE